jgi:YidC/Oxa1 family membrane protein insertase
VADLGDRRLHFGDYVFAPSVTEIHLEEGAPPATLELVFEGSGQRVTQRYRFYGDRYAIDYGLDLGSEIDGVLVSGLGPRVRSNEKRPAEDYRQMRAVVRIDDEIVSRQAKDVDEGEASSLAGRIDWAGLKSKYFLAMILAPEDGPTIRAATLSGSTADTMPQLEVAVGTAIEAGRSDYRIYAGPQEYGRLSSLNEGLDEVNQYGWSWIRWMVTPFAKWIVILMLWLHRFIPSYGLVLVAFGLIVRVVMWPLTSKSYRSIRAMQRLQPEIQQVREQFKSDPQRMQQETMSLYRENKVNPLGGCLPNLIPLPILFALFFVFQGTIEFRGQPFLWLPDLSLPDPLYILPVFMGATIWASSKITQTDPKMAAMTWLMPIVLTFVFFNLASGLVLYYAFSNLLTFVQQWWLRKASDRVVEEAPASP